MATPLSQFPKPEADQFKGKRKLFLIPIYALYPGVPEEGQQLLDRYWSEVRDHIHNLERSLSAVVHVYHETLFADGDEGMRLIESLNPQGYSFIQAMCISTATLEITSDKALVEEHMDWQSCMSVGLMSEKVRNIALQGYQETTQKRYEQIGARIEETLKEGEAGALFIREDHRVQFPADVQVFYIAPPALDALKRWMNDQMQASTQPQQQQDQGATQ